MTKNNSKNWLEIEEEFIQNFLVYFQDQRLEDPTIGVENGNTGIDALIVNDQIQKRAMNKANRVLNFFKPYFQEKMHEISLRELEEEHPLYKKEYNELPEIVDNNPKE